MRQKLKQKIVIRGPIFHIMIQQNTWNGSKLHKRRPSLISTLLVWHLVMAQEDNNLTGV